MWREALLSIAAATVPNAAARPQVGDVARLHRFAVKAERRQPLAEFVPMLLRQDLGGRHEGRLGPIRGCQRHRGGCDRRLAATNVAFEEAAAVRDAHARLSGGVGLIRSLARRLEATVNAARGYAAWLGRGCVVVLLALLFAVIITPAAIQVAGLD